MCTPISFLISPQSLYSFIYLYTFYKANLTMIKKLITIAKWQWHYNLLSWFVIKINQNIDWINTDWYVAFHLTNTLSIYSTSQAHWLSFISSASHICSFCQNTPFFFSLCSRVLPIPSSMSFQIYMFSFRSSLSIQTCLNYFSVYSCRSLYFQSHSSCVVE